ncbi:trans-AT polyketide synthase, acyltransferase and oxidoreductase domain-containing protein [Chitinophaga sp. CF118]|uniref:ACP S-malonyltransferase n=1 Tax=Chitinophaga sp. CF118 TaxID=1884367 RepID=UPI0008F1D95E|nr:ACP S-malonyltransferase [Chitinophaga sp. CF118]SFE51990.1 trans-AT polyketide synthase, acyltransferase and oxidoreductase domain-containing protein [Chitinophaga sp. CF118]
MKVIMFPGQGSQYKGMGKELFRAYNKEAQQASEILGYDLEELCVNDPKRQLGKTEFTQPALYVVNAFEYYKQHKDSRPDYLIGHSLGEYNALLAAGAFDFETGLRLVQKRGALMAAASGGGMAAVLGLNIATLTQKLEDNGYTDIDIANYNTPTQTVIAGPQASIDKVVKDFSDEGIKIIPLFVSAPFHSRYMKPAAEEFATFLNGFKFSSLQTPVIANATARPYEEGQTVALLSRQVASSVQWTDTIRFLMGKGITTHEEIGGAILTKMINEIKVSSTPLKEEKITISASLTSRQSTDLATCLGSHRFREDYGIKYAYLAGAMYRGIASRELVVCMGKAGMLGFVGTGGLSLEEIEKNIQYIQNELTTGEAYGMNLLHNLVDPAFEMRTVDLYLKYGVRKLEASAYMQITPSLVYYRLKGLRKGTDGNVICDHKILAKISRPEVAEVFMRPAPERIVNKLLEEEMITAEQAALSKKVPMSYDICVEADSGGHTDAGVAMVLLPSIQQLRAIIEKEEQYSQSIHIGLAGGIGTPQAVACAYMMGADFVLTGSINQCTVEARTSDAVKDLLQEINVQDTDYAPAGDMFEIGARVQVLKRGVLFPARANKLYSLYNQYNSLEEIPEKVIQQLEKNYFKKSIDEIWEESKTYFKRKGEQSTIEKAENNPKQKMALVFRWYFGHCNKLAIEGNITEKVNFQVHTGPALGAFNQWVKGTSLESWKNRHADRIGIKMMEEAAKLMEETLFRITN